MKWAVDYLKATTFRGTNGHSRMELKPERMIVEADTYNFGVGGELEFFASRDEGIMHREDLVIAFARGVWRTFEPVK